MTSSSSPRASLTALPAPRPPFEERLAPDAAPDSGDVAKLSRALDDRARLLDENAALRARLELLSSLGRAAWWDWDVGGERINAHGDLIELMHVELPPDLGTAGLGRWLDLIHPDDLRRARAAFGRCLADPSESASCELRVRARTGGYRWLLVALTACAPAERTRPLRVLGAARDVQSERAQRQTALRDAQVLGQLAEGVLCADVSGSIGYLNGAAARLLGIVSAQWLGRSLFDAFAMEQREELRELVAQALVGSSQWLQLEHASADGALRTLRLELRAHVDTAGVPLGVMCSLREEKAPPSAARTSR